MDEAVAAAPYLPGPGERLDVGTDQGAATQGDGHRIEIGRPVEVTGFLPAAQAVHGGLQGQLRTGTTLPVESLVAAQQLPVGQRPGGEGQRRVLVNRPLHEQDQASDQVPLAWWCLDGDGPPCLVLGQLITQ